MKPDPELRTDRLTLREFVPEDAPEVQRLVGARQWRARCPSPALTRTAWPRNGSLLTAPRSRTGGK
jgi:hypothetical protein